MKIFDWLFAPRHRLEVDVFGISDKGLVRPDNQDCMFLDSRQRLFCVADGIGGGEGGAQASFMICKAIALASKRKSCFASLINRTAEAIQATNTEIRAYALKNSLRQMGTTLAAMFINHDRPFEGVICHVGDSRIYRVRSGAFELLTHDHTIAGEIGRRSSLKAYSDEISRRAGGLSHVLTRAVGIEANVTPDWRKVDLRKRDRYLICSDGIYDMIPGEAILQTLSKDASAKEIAEELSRLAIKAGACDNYTAIVLKIGGIK